MRNRRVFLSLCTVLPQSESVEVRGVLKCGHGSFWIQTPALSADRQNGRVPNLKITPASLGFVGLVIDSCCRLSQGARVPVVRGVWCYIYFIHIYCPNAVIESLARTRSVWS